MSAPVVSSTGSAARADDTRNKLLLTALALYAGEGLHAVSLRRIAVDAGSKNSAAVHYHFKNKLGVLQALVKMIARELSSLARDLHSDRDTNGSRDCRDCRDNRKDRRDLRGACRDILQPLVRLPQQHAWGPDAVRFLSRMLSEGDDEIATLVSEFYSPFFNRLDKALARELPQLPQDVRRLRLMFISTNVLHGVAEAAWLKRSPLGDLSQFDEDTLLDHLVDYLIGGLTAPSTH